MDFLQQQQSDLDMVFEKFVELYYEDIENRLKETTLRTKKIYYRPQDFAIFQGQTDK